MFGMEADRWRILGPKLSVGLALLLFAGCSTFRSNRTDSSRPRLLSRNRQFLDREGVTRPATQTVEVGGKTSGNASAIPTRIIGVVNIASREMGTQRLDISEQGLTLGEAIASFRDPETNKLRITFDAKRTENSLAIHLQRANTDQYQPLFLAENTDSRLTPLKDGDTVRLEFWSETPLLDSGLYGRATMHDPDDKLERPLKMIEDKLDELDREAPTSQEVAEIKAEIQRLKDAGKNQEAGELNKQLLRPRLGTIQKYRNELETATTEEEAGIQSMLDKAEAEQKTLLVRLKLAKKRKDIGYQIMGLYQKPGKYNSSPVKSVANIGADENALSISGDQSANIIVLTRKHNDRFEQFVLPFLGTINGVTVPSDLGGVYKRLRSDAKVRDGDVYQYNQLRFLPSVLAGKMTQQRALAMRAAAPSRFVGVENNLLPPQVARSAQKEPNSFSTGWRQLQQRFPRVSAPNRRSRNPLVR